MNALFLHHLKFFRFLLWFGFLFFCFTILIVPQTDPVWQVYPDVQDYVHQSKADVLSKDFLFPESIGAFSPRPFTIPLFFKLVDSDPYKFILFQKILYCLFVICLILSVLVYLKSCFFKLLTQYILLFFFTWWNIVGWTDLPVSESLSNSFLLLWFAAILYYYYKPGNLSLILLFVVSFLLSFTRDSWPYVILLFFVFNVLFTKLININTFKKNLLLLVFPVCLFVFQNFTNNTGQRYKLPIFNSIAGRISKNDAFLDWFKNEGMPNAVELKQDFKSIDIDLEGRSVVYKRYSDSTYTKLFNWILEKGKSTYQKFVLTHPRYLLLLDIPSDKIAYNIFCYNTSYLSAPQGFFINADCVFPLFNIPVYLIVSIVTLILVFKTKQIKYIFLFLVFLLFTANAYLIYNADSMEIQRHLYITTIVFELASMLLILFAAEDFKLYLSSRKKSN